MIQSVEKVITWLENNQLQWWTVQRTNDDNTKVFDSIEDESYENRKNRFIVTMQDVTGGKFVVKAKRNKSDGRGIFSDEFSNLPAGIGSFAKETTPTVMGITEEKLEERIKAERANWERELELKALREQNKELQAAVKENDTMLNRVLGKLEPHIGMLAELGISKLFPQAPSVALGTTTQSINNIPQTPEDMTNEEINSRVETAVEKWMIADPDNFVTLIEFIADFAASGKTIDGPFGMKFDYNAVKALLK
ncbi:MAG: hypothetical protein WCL70_07985 [Paludibacter sp.]